MASRDTVLFRKNIGLSSFQCISFLFNIYKMSKVVFDISCKRLLSLSSGKKYVMEEHEFEDCYICSNSEYGLIHLGIFILLQN